MLRFVVLLACFCAMSSAQVMKPSPEAAIIKEARFLNLNGFGASYSQEDGIEFNEEADALGNRKGSYSYIDVNGQRKTVTYTAGKDGFHAFGDHLPVAPVPVPVQQVSHVPQAIYQTEVNPLVRFHTVTPLHTLVPVSPVPIISSTELPILRHYPPGKLNVQQSSDGFSYTFNSLI